MTFKIRNIRLLFQLSHCHSAYGHTKLYDLAWQKVNSAQWNYQVGKKYLKLMKLWQKYKAFCMCSFLFSQRYSSAVHMLSLCHMLLSKVVHTCGRTWDSERVRADDDGAMGWSSWEPNSPSSALSPCCSVTVQWHENHCPLWLENGTRILFSHVGCAHGL